MNHKHNQNIVLALITAFCLLLTFSAQTWAAVQSTATLEIRVAQGADDAEEANNNAVTLNSSDLELVYDGSNQIIGIRFQNLTIPNGSAITNAYILFTADEETSEPTSLTIWGEGVDNAAVYAAINKNISARTKTANFVDWNNVPEWGNVGEMGVSQQTPDLTDILQEIVNRPGWVSGNAMSFIIQGTGKRVAESYEGGSWKAPLLHVEYTAYMVDVRVNLASDDAEQRTDLAQSTPGLYDDDLDFRQDRIAGMRFQNVDVPKGAMITAAYIEFTARFDEEDNDASVFIDVEMHDSPPTFNSTVNNITDRTLSGDYIEWNPIPEFQDPGDKYRSPDLSALVQKIVGRPGWMPGNSMVFVLEGLEDNRNAASYDYHPDWAPLLHIEYGEGEIGIAEAIISVDREYLGATAMQTSNPASASVGLTNNGIGVLYYAISDTADWLSVSPGNGELLGGEAQQLTVSYNTAALAPGLYEATITITDPNALNNPVEIQVSVTVEPIPEGLSCGNIPVYTENLVSPAILILMDVSGSMNSTMEVAPEVKPQTPGLTAIVQEIVDRSGWASGNAMAFIIEGPGRRTAVAFDQDSARAPLLHVEYHDGLAAHVLEVRVDQDSDDAEEPIGGTSVNIKSADLEMSLDIGASNQAQITGVRFRNVTIPQGAMITRAYIQFEIDESDADPTSLTLWGEDMDDAPTFADANDNISSRSKTMAAVPWSNIEEWVGVTKERRIDIGKAAIGELFKDRSISWGFGTWCSKKPWADVVDGSYTLVHEGTKPNTDEHQAAVQAALTAITPNGGTPFSYSLLGGRYYFEGNKKDKDELGDTYVEVDCQPKFLIAITDGQGNSGSTVINTNERATALANAGVTGVGVGFGLSTTQAGQLYELAKVANAKGAVSETDKIYALHEEVNGVAQPFFANNKKELIDALSTITESVKGAIFRGSAPAPTTSEDLGDMVIVAKFDASRWTGDVEAVKKNAAGLWVEPEWKASENMPGPTQRNIYTVTGSTVDDYTDGTVVTYTDATLTGDHFDCLRQYKPMGDIINSTPVVVGKPPFYYPFDDYMKFMQKYSNPYYSGATPRESMIYIGANDGSLHAIDLEYGIERWAFIPPSMHYKLSQAQLDPLYDRCDAGYCHQYYVDGSPIVADVFDLFGGTGEEWRTVLVVGEREGGEAYFALDVTTGNDFGHADPTKFLWEFTDTELGQTWSNPSIERVAVKNSTTDTAWGTYFGSGYFGDPTLQANHQAYLYGIHANDATEFWQDKDGNPTNRIKMSFNNTGTIAYDGLVTEIPNVAGHIVTGLTSGAKGVIVAVHVIVPGSSGTIDLKNITGTFIDNEAITSSGGGDALVNGAMTGGIAMMNDALTSPLLVDMEADYIADRIYVGNLYGNMYRVTDIGENMTPQISALFSFDNTSPYTNPIRGKASFAYAENDNEIWVYFGTGKYEGQEDKSSANQQYFFGLKDGTTPVDTYRPGGIAVTLQAKFQTVNINGNMVTVRYIEGVNTDPPQSWKMQLDLGQGAWGGPLAAGSERSFTQPLVIGGIVFFTTFIPDANVCAGAGETWVMAVDYATGGAPSNPIFDINGDGNFNDGDLVDVNGTPVVPVGIKVGRGQGSNPVVHKDTLFITTSGDGDDGGGSGNPEEEFFAKKVNIPEMSIQVESWKQR